MSGVASATYPSWNTLGSNFFCIVSSWSCLLNCACQTTRCRCEPRIPPSSSTTSPGLRNCEGFMPAPTPSGVPVTTMSPGRSVMNSPARHDGTSMGFGLPIGWGRPAPTAAKCRGRTVFERRVIRVDEVAIDVVLDMEAGGIGPIVKDLAAMEMTAEVALVDHRLVAHAEIVEIAALEGHVIHDRRLRAHDRDRVVVGPGGAFVEVYEAGQNVGLVILVDELRRFHPERLAVPGDPLLRRRRQQRDMAQALDVRRPIGRTLERAQPLPRMRVVPLDRGVARGDGR